MLATPISFDDKGRYRRDFDIYQYYGLCPSKGAKPNAKIDEREDVSKDPTCIKTGAGGAPQTMPVLTAAEQSLIDDNITCGYIALPGDQLVIPGRLPMNDGTSLESFALAIAKAERSELVSDFTTERYGNFIRDKIFRQSSISVSAGALLNEPHNQEKHLRDVLEAKAVIVGGDWHRDALARGPLIDLHQTPLGPIVGAMLHANFVEALLDSRIFSTTPKQFLNGTEIAFGLIAAFAFALLQKTWQKILGIPSHGGVLVYGSMVPVARAGRVSRRHGARAWIGPAFTL